ncbi:dihydroxybiphenyl dioxygenase [Chloropicon primus]|uniref:Dihydroxybiphenyl dioxygenase n=1 Tax=Chloropicon primus TaxID=1764295 RepID=A0A5B8MF24_9CHLO|nr:dihydroxybiphenyl dioxygenase [Chloropicon primus]UPQ98088.1 dihydroxybiphenyl dioxygenase [Chloropicon primus]|eukprot:QDZ18881.1 dihydroxybiphenyl dioxygenase [Chloropicon primus]
MKSTANASDSNECCLERPGPSPKREQEQIARRTQYRKLNLQSFSHVSFVVQNLEASRKFYSELLGFSELVRPGSLKERCNGCWLFSYNIGLHLIEGVPPERPTEICPEADHFSFQCDDITEVEKQLTTLGVNYLSDQIDHAGVCISQLFFHDPDRNMVEVCNCDNAPLQFLHGGGGVCFPKSMNLTQHQHEENWKSQRGQQETSPLMM